MLAFALSGFITGIFCLIFGVFVFLKNKKAEINRVFSLLSLSIILWGFGYGMWQLSQNKEAALFWIKILSVGTLFMPSLFHHWVLILLDLKENKKGTLIFGYIISLFFLIFLPSSLFIKNIEPELYFLWWPKAGIFFNFFMIYFIGFMSYSLYLLIKAYKKEVGYKREQIKYTLIGVILGAGGATTNVPLWFGVHLVPFGTFFVPLYPFILGYAISRYRLMDIRLAIGKGIVYIISFVSVIGLTFLLLFLNNQLVRPIPINIAASLTLVVGILIFQPIFRFFEKIASKYFYYTFYSYQTVLTDLGEELTQFLDLDKLSSLIVNTLMNTMKLDRTVVLLREAGNGDYIIQKNIGFKEENGISLVKDNFLTIWLEKTQKPLVYEELSLVIRDTGKGELKTRLENLQENMKRIEAALCLPLLLENRIIGMIVLGNKLSGEPYSQQDIELLTTLSNQASIALQNAKSYSEIKNFNVRLEREIEKATKELKEAYEELQRLDKAKSEFVSIASHQLRTPLTAIRGYVSMILEKTYGKPPKKMERPLKNIYASNERLIKLVNDLLNVSRIEAGRMEVNFEKTSIEEIIISVVEELENEAKEKNIYLKYEPLSKTLPQVLVDKDKIRQGIMNVIDNAIRYTEKGGITIKLEKNDDTLRIIFSDTGVGLTKNELEEMFESFSRGAAGTQLYTEGVGLGLYVAKKFVEMNKGKIWAESKGKGKGSTFYIELPIA
jgi:signal transduction histidine kinase